MPIKEEPKKFVITCDMCGHTAEAHTTLYPFPSGFVPSLDIPPVQGDDAQLILCRECLKRIRIFVHTEHARMMNDRLNEMCSCGHTKRDCICPY